MTEHFVPGDRVRFKNQEGQDDDPHGTVRTWASKINRHYAWRHYKPEHWWNPRHWYLFYALWLDDLRYAQYRDAQHEYISVRWDNSADEYTCDGYLPNVLTHE